jgi:hypothetical protein
MEWQASVALVEPVAYPDVSFFPKLGKCYEVIHFLDLRGFPLQNPQANRLMAFRDKKSVSLVSLVSTVSFRCAYNSPLERRCLYAGDRP